MSRIWTNGWFSTSTLIQASKDFHWKRKKPTFSTTNFWIAAKKLRRSKEITETSFWLFSGVYKRENKMSRINPPQILVDSFVISGKEKSHKIILSMRTSWAIKQNLLIHLISIFIKDFFLRFHQLHLRVFHRFLIFLPLSVDIFLRHPLKLVNLEREWGEGELACKCLVIVFFSFIQNGKMDFLWREWFLFFIEGKLAELIVST